MNIARVDSIFPNDVIALMPAPKFYPQLQEKIKSKSISHAMVQT
jgi:hypothetical protein